MRTAVIFGVTGQDGSYLAELLLEKEYRVVGVARRTSNPNDGRIRHLLGRPGFELVQGDVTDPLCVYRLLWDTHAKEVYNLAAQSHVKVSFDEPAHTTDVTYKGCLNCLEAIRSLPVPAEQKPRFYQASSSEMFGTACSGYYGGRQEFSSYHLAMDVGATDLCQDENTNMLPCSPYAIAKLAAHHLVRLYRDAYGLFACSGILFNHESERRGEGFVTRKIAQYVAKLYQARWYGGDMEKLRLGNLSARRDWGHARDYVRGMWLMLQQQAADDYVLATGETHSVRDFLDIAFRVIGVSPDEHVVVDPGLFRPCEVPFLRGDATKAQSQLGWRPEISFEALVKRMVGADIARVQES